MPQLKTLMTEDEYNQVSTVIQNSDGSLRYIDEQVYTKMFGYSSVQDYYEAVSLENCC